MLCNDGACDVAGLLNEVDCAVEGGLEDDDDDDDDDDERQEEEEEGEEEEGEEEDEEEEDEEEEGEGGAVDNYDDQEGVCSGNIVHLSVKTFHANVAAAPFALVDFFATWCQF